jgi:hypothetical protein
VEDAERQHLLHQLAASEKARRRWRGLALVVTPVLAVFLVLALVNVVSLSLTLREVVKREQAQRERAEQAEREAQRLLYVSHLEARKQVYVSLMRQAALEAEMQQAGKPKP